MTVLAMDRTEIRPLLKHAALCLTVAGGLGFVAAGSRDLTLTPSGRFRSSCSTRSPLSASQPALPSFGVPRMALIGGDRLSFRAGLAKASSAVPRQSLPWAGWLRWGFSGSDKL
jgi:hypothetical protein